MVLITILWFLFDVDEMQGRWRGTVVAIKKLPFQTIDKELLKEIYREVSIMKYVVSNCLIQSIQILHFLFEIRFRYMMRVSQ
jgi:hypothetical protein